jgi:cis-3-alkyl-4-acyloxetan-2-one decarboxylase
VNPGAPAAPAAKGPAWRALYPFRSQFIGPDGRRMHYLDEGERHAPPLLLVHGNPTWSFHWRELVRAFRDAHRVVVPDHLGCGLSDKPQDWSYRLADHVANLERLVLELDLRDVTLGVHDWGGAIGMGVAVRHPERIARIVVLNTAAFRSTRIPLRIAACRLPLVGPLAVRGLNGFVLAALVMATEKRLPPAVRDGYLAPYDSWAARIGVLRFVQDIPMQPSHPSWPALFAIESALHTLREKPMLIVWGERDWCFTPAFREEWQRRFPDALVHRIPDAGHYVIEDARDEVIARVRAFLEQP